MRARLKTSGLTKMSKEMRGFKQRLQDLSPFFRVVATKGLKEIDSHFRQERSERGKWKPLKFRKGKPLQDTGNLRGSVVWRQSSKTSMEFLANAKYSGYHEYGTKNIPKRSFLWFPKDFKNDLIDNFARYVKKK